MANWKKARIAPLDIALDRDNPRIKVDPSDKESDIIRKLIHAVPLPQEAQNLLVGADGVGGRAGGVAGPASTT